MRTYSLISLLAVVQSVLSCSQFANYFTSCVYTYCQKDLNCYNQAIQQLDCGIEQCQSISDGNLWYNCFQNCFQTTCQVSYNVANDARDFCLNSYDFSQECTNAGTPQPSQTQTDPASGNQSVTTTTSNSSQLFISLALIALLSFIFA
ncbi:hypothetical protein ABPG74_001710 [Tetrahymena malaccensis]